MGYERQKLQILGGSFDCLLPVDKLDRHNYALAQNWRSDSLGRLISRAGYIQRFSIAGGGIAHSAGSPGSAGNEGYYVACNSGITNPASSVYFQDLPIASGFDGNRVGFAFQNGYAYIMNRGNQGRHSETGGFEAWNLAPPPASPQAATSAATKPPSFDVLYTYNLVGDPNYVHFLTIAGVVYSFAENGYAAQQIPLVLSLLAQNDKNCAVTYDGSSQQLHIQAVTPNTVIHVSGSDGNAAVNLLNGSAASESPVGTYQYYITFMSADGSLESNPSPVSNPTTTASGGGQKNTITIPTAPPPPNDAPTDPRVAFVNIYRSGGTQESVYRVASIASTIAAPATTYDDAMSDAVATTNDQTMPITNGAPPAASGIIGPFFSRLYAWSTVGNPNRLYYTPAGQPQYWNTDPQVGDFIDVGLDKEAIVWCSIHTNLLVIYKERSIWTLIGDPTTGQLEQAYDGFGLTSAFALAPAGQVDYFVGPGSLCLFDMSQVHQITGNVLPLFNQLLTNNGPLSSPGAILDGSAYNSNSLAPYALSLGHAMGKLYVGYAERGTGKYNLLVYAEGPSPERGANAYIQQAGRWFYHRNTYASLGFFGFFFDGEYMLGLSGTAAGNAVGMSLDDFRIYPTDDMGSSIECVYQSHYEDCGYPDNDKQFLEIAVDFYFGSGANANVYVGFNNGFVTPAVVGNLTPGPRRTLSFLFPIAQFPSLQDGGILARNISVLIDVGTTGTAIIHNVYVFYYLEARLGLIASTLPTDLGVGKAKECKELELDLNALGGQVTIAVISDLPGNALAVRQNPTSVVNTGRNVLNYPFPVTEGFLWQVVLASLASVPFRLYNVRLLMRVLGAYVQAYESAAGFVWDSMQVDMGDSDAKTLDQLRIELDTDAGTGTVSAILSTDLPGEAFAQRGTYTLVNQASAATPRAWVTVPLPDAVVPTPGGAIEARSIRVQTTGTIGYRLYTVQVRWRKIGRYLCGSTPSGNNDAFDVLAYDYRTERRKMFKRIEVDMHADGTVTMQTISDQDSTVAPPSVVLTSTFPATGGRLAQVVQLPPGIRGRLMRVRLTSPSPVRIYNLRVWTRTVDDPKSVWVWEDFPLEPTDILPHWSNLLIDETPSRWEWIDVPFSVGDN